MGSWLFPEKWMVPSLWDGVPTLIDGFQFYLQSVVTKKWVVTHGTKSNVSENEMEKTGENPLVSDQIKYLFFMVF